MRIHPSLAPGMLIPLKGHINIGASVLYDSFGVNVMRKRDTIWGRNSNRSRLTAYVAMVLALAQALDAGRHHASARSGRDDSSSINRCSWRDDSNTSTSKLITDDNHCSCPLFFITSRP